MSLKNWLSVHIPAPRYMSMAHVGVDISPVSIHVVELHKGGKEIMLGKFGAHELATPISFTEPLIQNKDLLEKLKEIKKTYHLDFVEVSIPEESAYLFTTNLPYGDEETIRNHIELHLEENVPLALADAVFDYHIIDANAFADKKRPGYMDNPKKNDEKVEEKTEVKADVKNDIKNDLKDNPGGETSNVAGSATQSTAGAEGRNEAKAEPVASVAASTAGAKKEENTISDISNLTHAAQKSFFASVSVVPKSLIDQYIELFEAADMTPVSFLIENQALSKSIIKQGDLGSKLIVHVGDRKSVLSIISEGSVQFTSTVNIGSEDLTLAIMKEYGVSREEAIRMKTEKGFEKKHNQVSIFMSLINTASALKDEIDRIVLYWQSYIDKRGKARTHSLESVVLSGRDALINGFREYLSATVRLPVEVANVWSNIYNLEENIPKIDYSDSLDYAVAIGLALPKLED